MAQFKLELSAKAHRQRCNCCQKDQLTVWGFVHRDDIAHAVYYAYMHPEDAGDPDRMLFLTISMGDWATETTPANRDWIQLKVRHDFQMMVRDADEAVLFGKDFLGRSMTREQAFKSPLPPQFCEIADFIVMQDPAVHSFLGGSSIALGVRQED